MNPTIEINLKNIKKNWLYLDGLSKKNIETGAVIKANAYGLGSNEVANALWEVGNRSFFVATAEEGILLNKILPKNENSQLKRAFSLKKNINLLKNYLFIDLQRGLKKTLKI